MAGIPDYDSMTEAELEEHLTCCQVDAIKGGNGHANSCNL